jgi:lipopolysaccharide transport system permease protein
VTVAVWGTRSWQSRLAFVPEQLLKCTGIGQRSYFVNRAIEKAPLRSVIASRIVLIRRLAVREIGMRYKGSVLGVLWSLLTPLLLLCVYTFVFGHVFQSRWPSDAAGDETGSMGRFAIILFIGLTTFQLFADSTTRAPSLILGHKNFVKKVVFPLEILPIVQVITSLFQYAVSISVVFAVLLITQGSLSVWALFLPVIVAPLVILIVGLTAALSAIGLFLRDIGQFIGTAVSAMLFLSPVFYSREALPPLMARIYLFNPITIPVEQTRNVLIWSRPPDFVLLGAYTLVSLTVAVVGFAMFQKLRRGFADVL